jgi:c-di-AMP phosphodiesterase-like protein
MNLHEPYASSTCELMAEVLQYVVTTSDILRQEAECMLAGVMLDTKNFTMKTGVRTFEAAAFFRRAGADTIEVKRMFQDDMEGYFKRCDIIKTAQKFHSDIVIASCPDEVSRPIAAQAADELLNIEGIQASFVVSAAPARRISPAGRWARSMSGDSSNAWAGAGVCWKRGPSWEIAAGDVVAQLKAAINAYSSTL